MGVAERLDDLLPRWRETSAPDLARKAMAIAAEAVAETPVQVDVGDPAVRQTLKEAITGRVTASAAEMLPDVLDWLEGQKVEVVGTGRLGAEVELALRQWLPSFEPYLPPPESRIPTASLAIAAALGAALGAVVLGPLSWLVLGQREPGLFAGGLAGAALTIGLLSWLSRQPKILGTLQAVVGAASLFAALAGVVSAVRSRSTGLLKGAAWIAGCWLVLVLARPRLVGPTPAACREALQPQVELLLAQATDSALALILCHPDRVAMQVKEKAGKKRPVLPPALVDALVVLDAVFKGLKKSGQPLELAIDAVLHRVRALGYDWRVVPPGTPYDAALVGQFDCFDLVEVGQPVETLEAAVLCDGEPVKRGMLRSVAG